MNLNKLGLINKTLAIKNIAELDKLVLKLEDNKLLYDNDKKESTNNNYNISLEGIIFPTENFWTSIGLGTALDQFLIKLNSLVIDNNFEEITVYIDSPGGLVDGVADASDQIKKLTKQKKIIAMVGSQASSAAYWLASAMTRIELTQTSEVGSIGVITTFLDDSEYLKMHGFKEFTYTNTDSPDKNFKPEKPAALIESLDTIARLFISTVAKNRKKTKEDVKVNFGQGWTVIGQDAIDRGMADSLYNSYNNFINNNTGEKNVMVNDNKEVLATADNTGVINSMREEENKESVGKKPIDSVIAVVESKQLSTDNNRVADIIGLCETADDLWTVKDLLTDGKSGKFEAMERLFKQSKQAKEKITNQYNLDAQSVPVIVHSQAKELTEDEQIELAARKKVGIK